MNSYKITTPRSVLILGSGGQKIGQAGEFDNAGLQAIEALKSEGIRTILVNPNMAAVQTGEGRADATYFLPITTEFLERIIEKERPDSILPVYGGKTALGCAMELESSGLLEKHNIQVLGTSLASQAVIEDRAALFTALAQAGVPLPAWTEAGSIDKANEAAHLLKWPLVIRPSLAADNTSPLTADTPDALVTATRQLLQHSERVVLEESMEGRKEIEFEILRDGMDNVIAAATLENIDPVGVHTGDSVIVIPALTPQGQHMAAMRRAALAAVRAIGLIGEANLRFALNSTTGDFRLIELTARISRSTILAAKAVAMPLPWLAARISLGFSLSEIPNALTGITRHCTEPVQDYIAVKVPVWDLDRFRTVDRHLDATMKSVGEALAFGRTFTEALQKALRMADPRTGGLAAHSQDFKDLRDALRNPTDRRLYAIYSALREGWSADRVHKHSGIDRYFIHCLQILSGIEEQLKAAATPDVALIRLAKQTGFSDAQIGCCVGIREEKVRALRLEAGIRPAIKQIDSTAAEFSSSSQILYLTYNGLANDVQPAARGPLVIGAGPYRIGSSLEYDWCTVQALKTCKKLGRAPILINCNPESVSTDANEAARLYFDEISLEVIRDIHDFEQPEGVLLSMGGQTASSLAVPLSRAKIQIFGTNPVDIDRAEDRYKFSAILDELDIRQPAWTEASSVDAALAFAARAGYPVLIKPDMVVTGAAASVAWDDASLKSILTRAVEISADSPVTMTKYIESTKEIEIDAVANHGDILVYAISEHLENAGVHSGDATVVLPAQRIYLATAQAIKKAARAVASALEITGPFNIHFLAKSTSIQILSCDLRASRSFPFCSKVFGIDFADYAVRAQLGAEVKKVEGSALDFDHVGIRAAQFSHSRLKGSDPVAGVEMTSTGEVGCLGRGVRDALMKAMLSTGYHIPRNKILLSTGPLEDKVDFIESARKLTAMGYSLVASSGTARFLQNNDIPATALPWPLEERHPNIADVLLSGEVDLVINIPKNNRETELKNDFSIRSMAVELGIPLITNIKIAKQFTDAVEWYKTRGLEVKSREDYR